MRTPLRWTRASQASLRVLCACCALSGAPATALSAAEPGGANAAPSARLPAASESAARHGHKRVSLDRRALILIGLGCCVGMIAGWVGMGAGRTRVRLLNKPTKGRPSVLVSPEPPPRLV